MTGIHLLITEWHYTETKTGEPYMVPLELQSAEIAFNNDRWKELAKYDSALAREARDSGRTAHVQAEFPRLGAEKTIIRARLVEAAQRRTGLFEHRCRSTEAWTNFVASDGWSR